MLNHNYRFILFGDNEQLLNDHCFNPYEEKIEWLNITDQVLSNFISPHIDIKFNEKSLNNKIEYIRDFYPNIKIIQDDLMFSSEFSNGDQAVFISENEEFLGVFEFCTRRILYSNYKISLNDDGFTLKSNPNTLKNGIRKSDIDFSAMIKGSNQIMLHKYNVYYKIKNSTKLDGKKLKQYILDHEPNHFDFSDDFSIFDLSFEDYCTLSSVNSFVPDFYFNLSGEPVIIINSDINKYIKNVKEFIRFINIIPENEKITQYEYQD